MDVQNEFTHDKAEIRRRLLTRRSSAADKPVLSRRAVARLLPLLRGNVMIYVSIGSELDTSGLIDVLLGNSDIALFAPYTSKGAIVPLPVKKRGAADRFGNMPCDCYADGFDAVKAAAVKIDVCVTPLVGFDDSGYRIGYGMGCYDRFFSMCDAYKIGLAFDCQRCEFRHESHDVPLDCCVTESKVIYF